MGQKVAQRSWFTPRQKQFLEVVSQEETFAKNFYLTGGTALAAAYYNHRESEDLDFFSPKDFDSNDILQLIFRTQKKLKWIKIKRREGGSTDMYTLLWKDGSGLNLDFVFYYQPLFPGPKIFGIKIDSVKDIAINKFDVIQTRSRARDYVDLFTILQRESITLKQLRKWHRKKFELEIEIKNLSKAFLKSREITTLPKMKIPFSRTKMIKFYENLARSLETEIFK